MPIPGKSGRRSSDSWTGCGYDPQWSRYPSRLQEVTVEGDFIEFEVGCPPLRQGVNELEVRLFQSDPSRGESLVLRDLRISIKYQNC